jgi:hypothetical protein
MSHKARWEYLKVIYARYQQAARESNHVILTEFCLNTHYHRKYAIRLLNGPPPRPRSSARSTPASLHLRTAGHFHSGRDLEGRQLLMVSAAESPVAALDALDAPAISDLPEPRAPTAADQFPADGSSPAPPQAAVEETDLRSHPRNLLERYDSPRPWRRLTISTARNCASGSTSTCLP